MKFKSILLSVMLVSPSLFAALIPPDRLIPWKNNVGVPNGIPSRSIICATVDADLYGRGQTDVSAVINSAIAACPDNQVVYLPAGHYKLSQPISFGTKSNVTLRGAGPEKTILVSHLSVNAKAIVLGGGGYNRMALNASILSGATKGSSEMTLSNVTGLATGNMMLINQENDPDMVFDTQNRERMLRQVFLIKEINGNTIKFDPPLVWTFSRTPELQYFKQVCRNSGVEDLKIDHTSGRAAMAIFMDGCYGCWIKNVDSVNVDNYHFWGYASSRCELRDSFANNAKTTGPNHGGLILSSDNSGWKVENNIFYKIFPGIEVSVSVGNAFLYNYLTDVDAGVGFIGVDMDDNHGPHVMMNLWEGNSGIMFQSDGYFGSASHGTLFRNHFRAEHRTLVQNRKAIGLNRWSYYYNVVGNVLGTTSFPDDGLYEVNVPFGYNTAVIYQLGYPNMGNNSFQGVRPPSTSDQARDLKVEQTILRHGNFDYKTKSLIWNSDAQFGSLDQTLPHSLLYETRPSWWSSSLAWPAIGPDLSPRVSKIPAEVRFEAFENGSEGTDLVYSENEEKNPFRSFNPVSLNGIDMNIVYELQETSTIKLYVADRDGQLLMLLKQGEESAGPQEAAWNGKNKSNERLGSGVYLLVLDVAGKSWVKKIAVVN